MNVPECRIRSANNRPINREGQYVLYWMIAYRRAGWNFALQRAIEAAVELNKPLIILEALSCDYPYASDRLHRFLIDGMAANVRAFQHQRVTYYPYIEAANGAGKGLLAAFSVQACLVVTDDFPAFFLPKIVTAAGAHLPMRLEAVDSNGLLPMACADHAFTTAYSFRRFLQKTLPPHLLILPAADPFTDTSLPDPVKPPYTIRDRWPDATPALQSGGPKLASLPLDHTIVPVSLCGGSDAARERLQEFCGHQLARYAEDRNHPDLDATSGLSPYLHFGHISSHQVFNMIAESEDWSPQRLSHRTDGKRSGWWGMSVNAEAFLDQLVTWRELGFNMCCFEPESYKRYQSLPDWAQTSLAEHRNDPRPISYTLEQFRSAATHDPLWNAAQRQLLEEGGIHNYLRMLWGKKILEWSTSPQQALEIMIELNDRYALDGRDPNSYSGILWCLGRYDRAWGPERPIFGKIRYMSSENTKRKVKLKKYLEKFGDG